MKYYLGFDIGGSFIKYAVGNPGELPIMQDKIPTPTASIEGFIHTFHQLIGRLLKEYGSKDLQGIGIATPGTIDRKSGLLKGVNPNLPWWVDIDPRIVVPPEYRKIALCDNDANLMALAEASGKKGMVLGITVGTGIGSGYVIDGAIYHGSKGFALELGHTKVVADGAICNCGLKGCVEAYSSVTAIQKLAAGIDAKYQELELSGIIKAQEKDKALKKGIRQAEKYLALALANAAMILDPDSIVLGGGAMDGGLYELARIRRHFKANTQKSYHHIQILPARYGNLAGVMGAIRLASLAMNDE